MEKETIKKIAILFSQDGLPFRIEDKHLAEIRSVIPDAEIFLAPSEEKLLQMTTDADMLMTWVTFSPVKFCKGAPSLKWVHCLNAGVNHVMVPGIADRDVIITNTSGIHGYPISEFVLCLILGQLHRIPHLMRQQQEKFWFRLQPDEAQGHTVGILGLGNIGKEIARKCKIMGFDVLGYKRKYEEYEYCDQVYAGEEGLMELLREADFVVSTLPLSPITEKMMGREQFLAMKKGSYFINVGRGGTVDEPALIWALQNGIIGGAGLDTYAVEPLPETSPLWHLPNVFISPHVSADSSLYMNRAFAIIRKNFKLYQNGEPLLNFVDKKVGY
jgi:phosphoglycerate dehydrogenase-like enzyme